MSLAVTPTLNRTPGSASRERVELILSHLDRLPALPLSVSRLLAVTTSDESSARDVVAVIESDASLTAGILRMVRMANLGIQDRVMTVSRAVTLLGFRTVRNAALSSRFFETLAPDRSDTPTAQLRRSLWEHSLAVGCAAELIAAKIGNGDLAGEAFVCGLVHDIGKIALDVCLPKSYTRAVEYAENRGACICDVEREVFGLDHTAAGRRLASRWQLPQTIVECVWLHHQNPRDLPSALGNTLLVRIVHLADNLVRRLRIGYSGYQHVADVNALANDLGLAPQGIASLSEGLLERMSPYRELLGLENAASPADAAESLNAANQRLSEINAQLMDANRAMTFRSVCLEAVGRFTAAVGEQDRLGDVCAAAAEAVAGVFDAARAVAFVSQNNSRCIHVGSYDVEARGRSACVVDMGTSAGADPPDDRSRGSTGMSEEQSFPVVPPGQGVFEATSDLRALWLRATDEPLAAPLWVLPIPLGGTRGGVLFAVEEQRVSPFRTAGDELAALTRTIDLSLMSARKRIEAESMNEELLDLNRRCRTAEKELVRMRSIAMVAEMAGGAAHELNNPLAVISGRAQMELAYALEPERRKAMETIIAQTQRASQIVLDLMGFAKPDPPQPALRPVSTIFERLSQYWKEASTLPPDRLRLGECDPNLAVYADDGQLREIFVAVLANAIGACNPQTGWVQVNSSSSASDETVRIVVEDNGAGMSPEVVEHVFDPFFSSRPAGRGRGLGLSRAYRLTEINGGRMWIDSTPQVGTTVTIELPARAPAA